MAIIKRIEEFGKQVAVMGFSEIKVEKVDALLEDIRKAVKAPVQIFDSSAIAGFDHLYFAALNALKAFHDGLNVSSNLAVEILLYASGQRQIREAIEMMGLKPQTSSAAVLIVADSRSELEDAMEKLATIMKGKMDDSALDIKTKEKADFLKRLFGITELEMEAKKGLKEAEALTELIVERVALLVTKLKG